MLSVFARTEELKKLRWRGVKDTIQHLQINIIMNLGFIYNKVKRVNMRDYFKT